jgi:O-antigen ligase
MMQGVFAAFLVLTLATPSWRVGAFTWWPLWRSAMFAGRPVAFGLLGLLPLLTVTLWALVRYLGRDRRPWRWGRLGIVLPLSGLTLLVLAGLDLALTWRTVVQTVGVGLMWFVLLFVLNEKPNLVLPLSLVVLIQGTVAVGQFLRQGDLGLELLGELVLDPAVQGVTVLWARDQRWLRAYGLTGHPNLLGANLAIWMLLLLPVLVQAKGWRRVSSTIVASMGVLGLLASFSRASWLAFGLGLSIWVAATWRGDGKTNLRTCLRLSPWPIHLIIPILLATIFVFSNQDLVTSRFFHLDTPIEANSLDERQRDSDLALRVIAAHPWRGVGAGNYLPAVRAIEPDSRPVHNIPLLATAELGLLGAVLLLWLTVSGLRARPEVVAPWIAMLVIGLFDNTVWFTTSWHAAIMMGILVAQSSRFRSSCIHKTSTMSP